MAGDGKKVPALGILIGMGKKPGSASDDESSEDMSEGDDEYSEELTDVADELAGHAVDAGGLGLRAGDAEPSLSGKCDPCSTHRFRSRGPW